MQDQKPAFNQITPETIATWKSEGHRNLSEVSVPKNPDELEGEKYRFVICQPSRAVTNAAAKYSKEKDFQKANKVVLSNCVLGGDMEALEDNKIELAVLSQIGELLEVKNVEVKKL